MGRSKTDTIQNELTRARVVRDQTDNKNEALVEDLSVCVDNLEGLFKLFQEQQNIILDVLIKNVILSINFPSIQTSRLPWKSIAARVLSINTSPASGTPILRLPRRPF